MPVTGRIVESDGDRVAVATEIGGKLYVAVFSSSDIAFAPTGDFATVNHGARPLAAREIVPPAAPVAIFPPNLREAILEAALAA